MLRVDTVETPLGPVHLAMREGALCALSFAPIEGPRAHVAESALVKAYFAGDVHALEVLPIDPAGTPFQRAVWALVRQIPAGETRSYRDLAARLGSSARAVGGANAANPIALAVPCHRVVAADGTLRGYAWGLERKEWLLRHERAAISAAAPAAAAG